METASGGRLSLRLKAATEDGADYVGDAEAPGGKWVLEARVRKDGHVAISRDASLPDWLFDFARAVLRTAFRSSAGVERMPRRISRWRAGPGERE